MLLLIIVRYFTVHILGNKKRNVNCLDMVYYVRLWKHLCVRKYAIISYDIKAE